MLACAITPVLLSASAGDVSQVRPLLDQISGPLDSMTADGADEGEPIHRALAEQQPDSPMAVVISSRSTAAPSPAANTTPSQRDQHHQLIRDKGALGLAEDSPLRRAIARRNGDVPLQGHHRQRPSCPDWYGGSRSMTSAFGSCSASALNHKTVQPHDQFRTIVPEVSWGCRGHSQRLH